MNLFGLLDISGSALHAQKIRAEIAASNLANAETTRTAEGGPYRKQSIVFRTQRIPGELSLRRAQPAGVIVEDVVSDPTPPIQRFDPGHPDADAQGYVALPAIEPAQEMVDLMGAARSYQLNIATVQAAKAMIQQALSILR